MIIQVWQRVMDLGKAGTSGMDTQDEFNGKVDSVQKSLQKLLITNAEGNQEITDALSWLKVSSGVLSTDANGKIALPSDYLHFDSATYVSGGNRYPVTKLATNEVDMVRTSPIRKGDVATNNINCYFKASSLFTEPEVINLVLDVTYYKKVPAATIVLTPGTGGAGDFLTPSVGTDFGWPESMFNLLVYMILEQFGVEVKEQLLTEYAQIGITREAITTNPK